MNKHRNLPREERRGKGEENDIYLLYAMMKEEMKKRIKLSVGVFIEEVYRVLGQGWQGHWVNQGG